MSVSPSSPRKFSEVSTSTEIPSPRRKQRAQKTNQQKRNLPFMEQDEFSDINIVVDGKQLFTNRCLLAYNSPVLRSRISGSGDGGKSSPTKGKEKKVTSSTSSNGLDLSDKSYDDVVQMLAYIDPRCDEPLTDKMAAALLPLADEFEMKKMKKDCEKTLTSSYAEMKRGRRVGMVPTDVTLDYLKLADKYDLDDLKRMCIEECVHNDNPFSNKTIADADGISERVKFQIVSRKYEKVHFALVKERRDRTAQEQGSSTGSKLWRN